MQVRRNLTLLIAEKTAKGKVITLTKVKSLPIGKATLTIGAGNPGYAIWQYDRTYPSGKIVSTSADPRHLADYLINFCGREHLKKNLPLWKYGG